jgi:hypothetical protein
MPPTRSVLRQLRSGRNKTRARFNRANRVGGSNVQHSNQRANLRSTSNTQRANDPSEFNVGALSVEPFGRTTFCGGVEFN